MVIKSRRFSVRILTSTQEAIWVKGLKVTGKQFGVELSDWTDRIQLAFSLNFHMVAVEMRSGLHKDKQRPPSHESGEWQLPKLKASRGVTALLMLFKTQWNNLLHWQYNVHRSFISSACLDIDLTFIRSAFQWSGVMCGFCNSNCP